MTSLYDQKRREEDLEATKTLSVDLTDIQDYYFNILKKNILETIHYMVVGFKKDLDVYWENVNDMSPTKQQMINWCNALEKFHGIIETELNQGETVLNLIGLSPSHNNDIRSLFFEQLYKAGEYMQEDLEYAPDEDIQSLAETKQRIQKLAWSINRKYIVV